MTQWRSPELSATSQHDLRPCIAGRNRSEKIPHTCLTHWKGHNQFRIPRPLKGFQMFLTCNASITSPRFAAAIVCCLLAHVTPSPVAMADEDQPAEVQSRVVFCAMGDVPYTAEEDQLLTKQIADLPGTAEFVVHVGDIKAGAPPCEETVYQKVAGMLRKSPHPLFIIPGDNEWNDCIEPDPQQAWRFWTRHFMRFERGWQHDLPVFRQLEREENFSFVRNGVLFVGLNIVGGRIHDPDEWKRRHAECLDWVRRNLKAKGSDVSSLVIFGHAKPVSNHSDFFNPFLEDAEQFGKPILYLHGDGHRWIHDRPFAAKNILRVQVDQGGIASPVQITVTNDPKEPFLFDRRLKEPEQSEPDANSPSR